MCLSPQFIGTLPRRERCTLGEKHAQLPAVDMLKVQGSLWCYSNLSPILIQPSLDAQSLCTLHSDCADSAFQESIIIRSKKKILSRFKYEDMKMYMFFPSDVLCTLLGKHIEILGYISHRKYFLKPADHLFLCGLF